MPRKTSAKARARVTEPEYLTLALRCPVCDTEFTAEAAEPGTQTGRDTDLRPLFEGADPLPSAIFCCPSCRYTAYREGFAGEADPDEEAGFGTLRTGDRPPPRFEAPEDSDLEDLRRWIRRGDLVAGLSEDREPFGSERYVLGGRCYEYLREDPLGAADYYLRASWCARATKTSERALQLDAAGRFQAALEGNLVSEHERPRVLYLAGELCRRAGDFARAVDFFTQIDAGADPDDEEAALFSHLAKRQLALAVVKSDVNASFKDADLLLDRS